MDTHNIKKHSPEQNEFLVRNISHSNPYDFAKLHRHTYYEVFLFEKADKGCQIIDFENYSLNSKSLYIVAPNQVHLMKRKKNEDGIVLQFTRDFLQTCISPIQFDLLYQFRTSPQTTLSNSKFKQLYSSFQKLKSIFESKDNYKLKQTQHYFAYSIFQILEVLSSSVKLNENKSIAYEFLEIAESNFKEQRKVSVYAQQLTISVNSLNKCLKNKFGKTALEILHNLLLTEVKRLLLVEQISNKEISFALNFDSPSSYSRFIRKQTGLSPSELKSNLHRNS